MPPLRAGVAASTVQLPPGSWPSLYAFLCAHFATISAGEWRARFERGLVFDESGQPLALEAPYRSGLRVRYYRELASEVAVPFEAAVLYRDEHLLIADKPHFLPVIPSGRHLQETLLVRLKHALDLPALTPLHRIDRDTAGLVMFSVNPQTRAQYQALFPQRAMHKVYEALAPALPSLRFPLERRSRIVTGEPFFRSAEVDGEPNSHTRIEVVETRGAHSLYRLLPVTGRKHQLRVHLAALGAGIVNDPFYPELSDAVAADDFSRPLQLLARSLSFVDPLSGVEREFVSERGLDWGSVSA
jgi:tRNA pseudouridine32 synthase/23S rRNA pseudouridine746 synthase